MDCAMEQSLKKTAVHMYGVYSTPVAFASHPRRSVGLARFSLNGTRGSDLGLDERAGAL